MRFNILDGTPKEGTPLCESCTYNGMAKGTNGERASTCRDGLFSNGVFGNVAPVTFNVYSCTSYREKNTPSLERMQEIAWNISACPRGTVGFAEGADKHDPNELIMVIEPPKKRVYK
jgi:hypothetical protein